MAHQDEEWEGVILEALLQRAEEGMTIFELRNQIDANIDTIEASLERLKDRGLIQTEQTDGRVSIRPTERALRLHREESTAQSWFERIREWLFP